MFRKGGCGLVRMTGFSVTRVFFWGWVATIGVMEVVFQ